MTESPEQIATKRLEVAATRVARLYARDADLVRPAAERYGVNVSEGGIFTPPVRGYYNARIPNGSGTEAILLAHAQSITTMCEDFRQSAETTEQIGLEIAPGKDALFSPAGGAAQPEESRRESAIEFITAAYKLNPHMDINLVVHNNVCGGVDYYTNGGATKARKKSVQDELKLMMLHEIALAHGLVKNGVSPRQLRMYISEVDHDHSFLKVVSLR